MGVIHDPKGALLHRRLVLGWAHFPLWPCSTGCSTPPAPRAVG